MEIGQSFGFVFDDERWGSKVLVGGLLGLIPIVNLAALGYVSPYTGQVSENLSGVRRVSTAILGSNRAAPDSF